MTKPTTITQLIKKHPFLEWRAYEQMGLLEDIKHVVKSQRIP